MTPTKLDTALSTRPSQKKRLVHSEYTTLHADGAPGRIVYLTRGIVLLEQLEDGSVYGQRTVADWLIEHLHNTTMNSIGLVVKQVLWESGSSAQWLAEYCTGEPQEIIKDT